MSIYRHGWGKSRRGGGDARDAQNRVGGVAPRQNIAARSNSSPAPAHAAKIRGGVQRAGGGARDMGALRAGQWERRGFLTNKSSLIFESSCKGARCVCVRGEIRRGTLEK